MEEGNSSSIIRWRSPWLWVFFVLCALVFMIAQYIQSQNTSSTVVLACEAVKTLAIAVFSGGFVAVLDHAFTIKETSNEIISQTRKLLTDEVADKLDRLMEGREHYGLVRFHNRMDFEALFDKLEAGDKLLWLDTYCPSYQGFTDKLQEALRRGAQIQMLVIDPCSENAQYRAGEIGKLYDPGPRLYQPAAFQRDVGSFKDSMEAIAQTASSNSSFKGSLDICVYRDLPCMPIYIILRAGKLFKGYSSFFLTKPTGINFVHLEWAPREEGILEEMKYYFDQKWTKQIQQSNVFISSEQKDNFRNEKVNIDETSSLQTD